MDDRRRTLAAVTLLFGFFILIAIVVGVLLSARKTVSPVPEDNAIKIIFISPTPVPLALPSATPVPAKTKP
ncbi:hypothetical protein HY950_03390 [Candidatus Gottesmanbacteria bacterium]|nr:hypothetical protein [Candidatus Gottesmanbacteria bacterium]